MKRNMKVKLSLIISIIGLLLLITGTSYALLTDDTVSDNNQIIKAGETKLSLSDSEVSLSGLSILTDEEGMAQDQYFDFSISNIGNGDANVLVSLLDNGSSSTLLAKYIRVGVSKNSGTQTVINLESANRIISETLIKEEETVNYRIRVWLDEKTLGEDGITVETGATLNLKITLTASTHVKNSLYKTLEDNSNTSVTPNFAYISNYNTNGINVNDNGIFLYDGTDDNGGGKAIYYYRGNVDNNNVLFGGYCWKIIRTTSTGGTKMIYNGTPKTEYTNLEKLEQSDYLNVTNSSSSPYTFDTSTKKWTSGSIENTTFSEISFTVAGGDDYILEYDVSSEGNCDIVYIYKDGTEIKTLSGVDTGQIDLGTLTSSNIIKIKYSKDGTTVVGRDNVIFSLNKKNSLSTSYTTCDNSGEESQIDKTSFNSSYDSPSDVGYMYGTRYAYNSKIMTSITDTYYYGNDVTYSDGTYTLTNTITSVGSDWNTDKSIITNGHRYTCFSTGTTCSKVYYLNYVDSSMAYYLTFSNGDTLDSAKDKMYTNTNDSTIKTTIDSWYNANLSSYSSYLENTIFCNERTLYSGPLYSKDADSTNDSYYIAKQNLSNGTPSLTCLNNNDKFSLNISNGGTTGYGNNALTYPIGLITSDEFVIAGSASGHVGTNFYLYSGLSTWTISPSGWNGTNSFILGLFLSDSFGSGYVGYVGGTRPAISLKAGTTIIRGDGTYTNPYVITE